MLDRSLWSDAEVISFLLVGLLLKLLKKMIQEVQFEVKVYQMSKHCRGFWYGRNMLFMLQIMSTRLVH